MQESYIVLNNVAGFAKSFRIFAHDNGRKRSAIIVDKKKIDAIAIRQVSDEDATLIELSYSGLNFYGASLYSPIDRENERHRITGGNHTAYKREGNITLH